MTRSVQIPTSLRRCLRRREWSAVLKALGLALLAVPGLLVVNALLSGFLWICLPARFHVGFGRLFAVCFVINVAFFGLIEWLTPRPEAGEEPTGDPGLNTAGGHLAISTADPPRGSEGPGVFLLTVLLLAGPNILRTACRRLFAIAGVRSADRERAAQVLRELEAVNHSVAVTHLLRPDEDPHVVQLCVSYLSAFGWLDASTDGERVWLRSTTRNILRDHPVNLSMRSSK